MPLTTITSKGQMTLPREVRDQLRLKPGDRLEVIVEDRHILLRPATLDLDDFCAILPPSPTAHSVEEMDNSIRSRAAKRV